MRPMKGLDILRHGCVLTVSLLGPQTPVGSAFTSGLQGAGVGLLVSSVQNSVQKVSAHGMVSALLLAQTDSRSLFVGKQHKQGALGVLTRTGGTIGLFGEDR